MGRKSFSSALKMSPACAQQMSKTLNFLDPPARPFLCLFGAVGRAQQIGTRIEVQRTLHHPVGRAQHIAASLAAPNNFKCGWAHLAQPC